MANFLVPVSQWAIMAALWPGSLVALREPAKSLGQSGPEAKFRVVGELREDAGTIIRITFKGATQSLPPRAIQFSL